MLSYVQGILLVSGLSNFKPYPEIQIFQAYPEIQIFGLILIQRPVSYFKVFPGKGLFIKA